MYLKLQIYKRLEMNYIHLLYLKINLFIKDVLKRSVYTHG